MSEEQLACKLKVRAIHDTMDVLSGKWKVSIIACLCYQGMRFSELLKEIEGISGRMLSRELKDLEMNKLIERSVIESKPVRVHNKITPYGASLKELTNVIAKWGLKHRALITEDFRKLEV